MHFLIGTAGHVDHGKTALIRALTGIETDRLREEKERGLSIVPALRFWIWMATIAQAACAAWASWMCRGTSGS
jgi:translation initiation factor 2 gamma subunit (eIF-2gamma)